MKERLIIIIVALISGLFITSAGFLIYQSTKKGNDIAVTPKKIEQNTINQNEEIKNTVFIKVNEPLDESITQKRTIQVKGITNPENTVMVSSNLEDLTGKPTKDGNFTFTIDISAGANIIITRSITPDGESVEDKRTITYSTEEF